SIYDRASPGRIRTVRAEKVQEAIDERPAAFQNELTMIGAAVAIDPRPEEIMPAKHPGVIQFKFIGWAVHVPAVAAIELADLHQPIVDIIYRGGKPKMMTYCLGHGREQDPVIGVSAFAIHLRKPGHDLFLLGLGHFVEDTFATHPNCHGDISAFNDSLIQMTDITPIR